MTAPAPGRRGDLVALAALLALSVVVAGVSAVVTWHSVGTWYPTLAKPPFNPPNAVFGPVWTVLYIAMAVAAWRVWKQGDRGRGTRPRGLYAGRMALRVCRRLLH